MDAAQRAVYDQIDQATQRLLDDARLIPEADLRAPSLLPGWTRAHVLAHVARDAMRCGTCWPAPGRGRTAPVTPALRRGRPTSNGAPLAEQRT